MLLTPLSPLHVVDPSLCIWPTTCNGIHLTLVKIASFVHVVIEIVLVFVCGQKHTINGESFTGLNFRGFDPMKYFAEILSRFIGQECSQL